MNLVAPALLTRALLPALRAARGTVVFVNSGAGLAAHPQWSAYAASKFGLRALADALRAEEQEHGVRVTTVFPGRTATPMQEKVHAPGGQGVRRRRRGSGPETVADAILHVLDLPPRRHRPRGAALADAGRARPVGSGARAPVQGADQHHPQLGAGGLDDPLLGAVGAAGGAP